MNGWSVLSQVFGWGGVLAYHGVGENPHSPGMHVSPQHLRDQLAYLKHRYEVVPLSELVARWRSGRGTRGCVAVTFDDAYAGVVRYAEPILRDLGLPATVFVATGPSELGAVFWWDSVELDRLGHQGRPWKNLPASLGLPVLPADQASMELVRARVLGDHDGRLHSGAFRGAESPVWRAATFAELSALAENPLIDFGVHTVTHPALPMLSYEEQVAEMRDCYRVLKDELPRVLAAVAYPYGLYDRQTIRAAREAGMDAGFSIEGRAPAARPHMYTIPRVGAANVHRAQVLERRLSRALRPALIVRNGSVHPRLPRRSGLGRASAV